MNNGNISNKPKFKIALLTVWKIELEFLKGRQIIFGIFEPINICLKEM